MYTHLRFILSFSQIVQTYYVDKSRQMRSTLQPNRWC